MSNYFNLRRQDTGHKIDLFARSLDCDSLKVESLNNANILTNKITLGNTTATQESLELWYSNSNTNGIEGDRGPRGLTGAKGLLGIQGLQGLQGDVGESGGVGDRGDDGDSGSQGNQGFEGGQGPKGAKGLKGESGNKGAMGLWPSVHARGIERYLKSAYLYNLQAFNFIRPSDYERDMPDFYKAVKGPHLAFSLANLDIALFDNRVCTGLAIESLNPNIAYYKCYVIQNAADIQRVNRDPLAPIDYRFYKHFTFHIVVENPGVYEGLFTRAQFVIQSKLFDTNITLSAFPGVVVCVAYEPEGQIAAWS